MIGSRLAELRKDKGLSQKDLAKILSVSLESISKYERGLSDPNDNTKIAIAELFQVSLDYLLGLVEEQMPYTRKDVINIPSGFPAYAVPDVLDYMNYIMYKEVRKKHKDELHSHITKRI